jgi:ribosomal protein L16 Arg81 hydroxylase
MSLQFGKIDEVENLTPADFRQNYLRKRKPVLFKKTIAGQWPAFSKWTPEFFKQQCGSKIVDLYNNVKSDAHTPVNKPDEQMPFDRYMDLITSQPTDLRIFLFNAFKHVPGLLSDFSYPEEYMKGFLKRYPMLFFGGAGSQVHMHYDMDMPNIMLTQFHGSKRVVLFGPEQSELLYRMPFMVQTYVDIENPDYDTYPALQFARGQECIMEHGDTLFIPSGYWHYMYYNEGGYALALRAFDPSLKIKAQGMYNLFIMRHIDDTLKKMAGQDWYDLKKSMAFQRADMAIERIRSNAGQMEPLRV